ncbi:MAG: FAD-dependent oxidoreductase [Pirellulales bacterium]|nr:FAD-dependent oxidoreductase [Pirellulales bacterium]
MSRPDVLIVGGGIIGAACALDLAQCGARVTLLDKGEMGSGCSYGNAGWITPCFAMPLPMPGMLKTAFRWLLDADSPLYIQPRISWTLFRWLLRFLRSMKKSQMERAIAALTELSKFSLAAYCELDAQQPGAFDFQQRGLLIVAQTPAGMDAARLEMALASKHAIPGRELDAAAVRELEPAITGAGIIGGIYFPSEAHAEPLATVQHFVRQAQLHGATVLPNTEVFGFNSVGKRIASVRTTCGEFFANEFVMAAGAWSRQLGRELGLRIPILGGKGYAIITQPLSPPPERPCLLIERKIAITPRHNSVRIAGTLELVDLDESITSRRVRALIDGARQYLNVPVEPKIVELWRGLRPCTPDGLPIVGRACGFENLTLATGHQMLGLLTAPATGRLVADLILNRTPTFDPQPFSAARF